MKRCYSQGCTVRMVIVVEGLRRGDDRIRKVETRRLEEKTETYGDKTWK